MTRTEMTAQWATTHNVTDSADDADYAGVNLADQVYYDHLRFGGREKGTGRRSTTNQRLGIAAACRWGREYHRRG